LKHEKAPDWYRQAIFYQIFPDSFARKGHLENSKDNIFFYGKETDPPYYIREANGDITHWTYYGGNIVGIIDKIPISNHWVSRRFTSIPFLKLEVLIAMIRVIT
jgi:hypothetical protein